MIRVKSRIVYRSRQYPLVALLDVFFILLMLFVVHSSKFYVTGAVIGLNGGQSTTATGDHIGVVENEHLARPDRRPYVVADQMVLVILPKDMAVQSSVTPAATALDTRNDTAATAAASSPNAATAAPSSVETAGAPYKLELNSKPVTLAGLSDALIQAAERLRRNYNSVQRLEDEEDDGQYRPRLVVIATPEIPVAVLNEVFGKIRQKNMDVVFKMAKY